VVAGWLARVRLEKLMKKTVPRAVLAWGIAAGLLTAHQGHAESADAISRGAYLFRIAGCQGCHTDVKNKGAPLAGGRALATPFGTFYGPNITAHPKEGIGGWSDADFVRALREGISPEGQNLFPVFPYPSFTGMSEADMLAIKAYIFSLPPADRVNRPHEVDFPFGWRFLLTFWKWINFSEGPMTSDPKQSEAWNRGAYLVKAVAHCGECHTPRDALGALDAAMDFAGTLDGPDGWAVPNITSDPETGIGRWSDGDLRFLFRTSLLPDGDAVDGVMAEVVENGTSHLNDNDLEAIITYLKALPPIHNKIERKPEKAASDDDW
jgi:mono/diheme cytochrome c family protein